MRSVFKVMLAATALLTISGAAQAAYLHPAFDPARGGSICYGRTYSAAFLKKNPSLNLVAISIERRNTIATGTPNKPSKFRIAFGATTKAENYTADAYCKTAGKIISCTMEADGGSLTLQRAGKTLYIKTRRISIEGTFKQLEIISKKGAATRSFTLTGHGKKACAAVFD